MALASNWLVPLAYVTVDNSGASVGSTALTYKAVMIGQMLAAGTATENAPVLLSSKGDEGDDLFGAGSILSKMVKAWKAINTTVALEVIPQLDAGSAVAATGTFTITGTATANGTLTAYVDGTQYPVAVILGDTNAEIATNLAAAITADANALVTAAAVTEVVTVTVKNKGLVGNEIDLRVNYFPEDKLPAGVTAAVVAMSGGLLNPDLTATVVAMGDTWYQVVANQYTDSPSMLQIEAEMESRWGVLRGIGGESFSTISNAILSDYTTYLSTRNSAFSTTIMGHKINGSAFTLTAEVAATVARYGQIDPAAPFQFKKLNVLPPVLNDQFVAEDRNILLNAGGATVTRTESGGLAVEYIRTTYTKNDAGGDDISYRDVNTILTLITMGFDVKNLFLKFNDYKMANNGSSVSGNQKIMTTNLASSLLLSLNQEWITRGLAEDTDEFKQGLSVVRDLPNNPNRLIIYITPDLINQFRQADVTNLFRL